MVNAVARPIFAGTRATKNSAVMAPIRPAELKTKNVSPAAVIEISYLARISGIKGPSEAAAKPTTAAVPNNPA